MSAAVFQIISTGSCFSLVYFIMLIEIKLLWCREQNMKQWLLARLQTCKFYNSPRFIT